MDLDISLDSEYHQIRYIIFYYDCNVLGVTNLRALLAREKDEDTPRLSVLLCEAFVATYMSLIVYALATCDSLILYRLAGQKFNNQTWAMLFGGGVKKLLKVAASGNSATQVSFMYQLFLSVNR
jgi:hypothetical protein